MTDSQLSTPAFAEQRCAEGRCGPVEDASDYPEWFAELSAADVLGVPAQQLGRCARCGRFWRWSVQGQRWEPLLT
jgi:hypothetical protein